MKTKLPSEITVIQEISSALVRERNVRALLDDVLGILEKRMDKKKIVNARGESEVDGLKTGYAEYCGSSIILTGKRDGRRAIVIVVGSETSKMRDEHARRLMVEALDAVSR